MEMAQQISSMILALRRKVSISVRQPLAKAMIPASNKKMKKQIDAVKDLILTETNIKEIEYIDDTDGILVKKIKPNFRALGPRMGKMMKEAGAIISAMTQKEIAAFEKSDSHTITDRRREVCHHPRGCGDHKRGYTRMAGGQRGQADGST